MTAEQMTAQILTDPHLSEGQRSRKLAALARAVSIMTGALCPECLSDNVQDNGARRDADLAYCCQDCGAQWDAEPV